MASQHRKVASTQPSSQPRESKVSSRSLTEDGIAAKEAASESFKRLKACKEEYEAIAGRARTKLWALLASMYVFHERATQVPEYRDKLIMQVKAMRCEGLKPETMSTLDLLTLYAVGNDSDTASSRSQYAACVGAAISDSNVEPTEKAFLAWLKRKGGLVKSIQRAKKEDPALQGVVVPFSFEKFKDHMARVAPRQQLNIDIDPERDIFEGFTVLFAAYDREAQEPLKLIEAIGDEKVIRSVATVVAKQRVKNLSDEEKAAIRRDQHLWTLNRIALKLAKRISGAVSWEDAEEWQIAHVALQGEDGVKREYFKGLARAKFEDPKGLGRLKLPVVNEDFHPLDPGRYIPMAIKGKLAPYDLETVGTPEGDRVLRAYIDKHFDPYIYTS
jgi:hypothetical protein